MNIYTTIANRSDVRTAMRPEDLIPPPDFRGKPIVFSDDFHPLDHTFADDRCRELQPRLRGPYLHVKIQWQYRPPGDRICTLLHRYTTCLLGAAPVLDGLEVTATSGYSCTGAAPGAGVTTLS
jgi:hypothetical protein